MAERDYMRGGAITPIQDMTTRQLRRYIRERAEEANARINTIKDVEDTSQAFQLQLDFVKSFGSGRGGNIKKDTSHMSKEEMEEYAYAVRDLNMLDTESKYARDKDYKQNKERYEKFVRERTREDNPNQEEKERWKKYITEKNNVSKRGYQEYKNFINFVRNIDEVMSTYGYETIKDYYYDETDQEEQAFVADLLLSTYEENKGQGKTPADLLDIFNDKLKAHHEEKAKKIQANLNISSKASGSRSNIKAKTTGKMKNGTIREKQTTKKL